MRRALTPCAITQNLSHHPLARAAFSDRRIAESFLQQALHQSPLLLPIDEIDTAFGPLATLGRELECIDNLFISPTGRLTLVETKLWRNPESGREVVGQLLDYASTISGYSYEAFESLIRAGSFSPLNPGESLYAYIRRVFPEDILDESAFIDALQKTLRTGRFLLLIVGDGIREGVERMLHNLHDHPQRHFTFGLVEIGIYENPALFNGRILIPSLVAKTTEVIRAVVRVDASGPANVSIVTAHDEEATTSPGYQRRTLSEQEFFDGLPDETARSLYTRLFAFAAEVGAEKTWRASSVSIRLPDPAGSDSLFTLFVLHNGGDVSAGFLANQLSRRGLPVNISERYISSLCEMFSNVSPHRSLPGHLSRHLTASEITQYYDIFTNAVRRAIEEIKSASEECSRGSLER
jgi:hypothetical protein